MYQNFLLFTHRKPGNIATSMGTKSPVVTVDTAHSAKVDYKYNAKPKPFGAPPKSSAPVKTNPPASTV